MTESVKLEQEIEPDVPRIGGLEIVDLDDEQTHIKLLVYGDSGVGKTVLVTSAAAVPSMAPVLVLNFEGGLLSTKNMTERLGIPKGALKTVKIVDFYDIEKVYNELAHMDHPFRTVIIDSLTELQKKSMATIMKETVRKDPSRDPDVPAQRDWGKTIEQVRRIVRGFRDLEMHVLMTCLVKEDRDEITGEVRVRPNLPGKAAGEIPQFFDEVFYMYNTVDGSGEERLVHRHVLTQNSGKYTGKDRSSRLSLIMDDPTMLSIMQGIFETEE